MEVAAETENRGTATGSAQIPTVAIPTSPGGISAIGATRRNRKGPAAEAVAAGMTEGEVEVVADLEVATDVAEAAEVVEVTEEAVADVEEADSAEVAVEAEAAAEGNFNKCAIIIFS